MPRPFASYKDSGSSGGSASAVVGRILAVGAFVVGRCAEDVEVLIEVDVDLAAVVLGNLDLVGALFVASLGASHAPFTWSSATLLALSTPGPVACPEESSPEPVA